MKKILVVDEEQEICTFFDCFISKHGYKVKAVQSSREALEVLENEKFNLAILDQRTSNENEQSLLKKIKELDNRCQIILMTNNNTVNSEIDLFDNMVLDYIEKPFDAVKLQVLIDRALNPKNFTIAEDIRIKAFESGLVIGNNQEMLQLMDLARRIALKNVTVLIQGETGTGKELMARFIHNCSPRANEPFIPINCAAISENLLESELFGHEKGAFTGANRTRKGFFEIASVGTIFLDEIGEASPSTQAKLLRVLETGEFFRVGGEAMHRTDARIIAATNIVLNQAVNDRQFRQDLFYRLDVFTLRTPPLRERSEDIPLYLDYFLSRFSDGKEIKIQQFSSESIDLLAGYDWPGNVRELVNLVQWLLTVVDEPIILPHHLPDKITNKQPLVDSENIPENMEDGAVVLDNNTAAWMDKMIADMREESALWIDKTINEMRTSTKIDLNKMLEDFTELKNQTAKRIIESTLAKTLGDRKAAAKMLGITPRTLKYIYRGK